MITFNIARATAVAAAMRKKVINIPTRITNTSRRVDLHFPIHLP